MKLTREATTAANPDLRGRKHHFIIESATAAELEAMDEILTLAGWENDSCPCYEGSSQKTESMVTPVFATPILTTSWLA